jgi:hypothetical protein
MADTSLHGHIEPYPQQPPTILTGRSEATFKLQVLLQPGRDAITKDLSVPYDLVETVWADNNSVQLRLKADVVIRGQVPMLEERRDL